MGDTQQTSRTANEHRFSIVIPVLDEQERINSCIEQTLSLCPAGTCEIIVVDADPDGATINAVTSDKVITTVCEPGRAKQMNAGAALAQGEVIIFLHADTQLPTGAFDYIEEALSNTQYVGGAFALSVDSSNLIIRFIVVMAQVRSRVARIPYGDQAIFMRRDYFEKIGRFKEIPLMEDVELMRRIKRHGDKICLLSERVLTSARRWEKEGIVYTIFRNLIISGLYYLGARPGKLAKYYRRHS